MTIKLYDQDSHCRAFSARVLTCQAAGEGRWQVTLDQTAFFPEGGGQPADRGTLGGAAVLDVQEVGEAILHTTDAPLTPGTTVQGTLDWPLRFGRMQCHSGEHVISGLAHSLYGCTNVGFHMGEDAVILDFDKELSPAQLREIEDRANAIITENRPVTAVYPDPDTLAGLDYRSKLDLTENVRIVTIEGCDVCACCAPHVKHTGGDRPGQTPGRHAPPGGHPHLDGRREAGPPGLPGQAGEHRRHLRRPVRPAAPGRPGIDIRIGGRWRASRRP